MTFTQAVRSVLSKYVEFSGRARRSEYWWFYLFTVIVGVVTSGIDGVYPSGLPVAKVVDIERNATMAFARITCEPLSGVDRRNHVLVLNPMRELPERPAEKPEPALKQKKPKRGAP